VPTVSSAMYYTQSHSELEYYVLEHLNFQFSILVSGAVLSVSLMPLPT